MAYINMYMWIFSEYLFFHHGFSLDPGRIWGFRSHKNVGVFFSDWQLYRSESPRCPFLVWIDLPLPLEFPPCVPSDVEARLNEENELYICIYTTTMTMRRAWLRQRKEAWQEVNTIKMTCTTMKEVLASLSESLDALIRTLFNILMSKMCSVSCTYCFVGFYRLDNREMDYVLPPSQFMMYIRFDQSQTS
jgi:hypothetical protein